MEVPWHGFFSVIRVGTLPALNNWPRYLHTRVMKSGGIGTSTADLASLQRSIVPLRTAEPVVVLWSETSIQSAWVQDEAAEGRDTGRLIPLTLGAAMRRSASGSFID